MINPIACCKIHKPLNTMQKASVSTFISITISKYCQANLSNRCQRVYYYCIKALVTYLVQYVQLTLHKDQSEKNYDDKKRVQ
jgi:hypothetical protein